MLMLIPLRVDVPMDRLPWVNCALIIVVIALSVLGLTDTKFLLKMSGAEAVAAEEGWGRLTTEDYPLPVLAVTSSLVHTGWFHLAGNMLFLWVFGSAVNYKFGQIQYLGLFLVTALASGMTHYAFDWSPCAGASGAIYGIMGAFLVFFPRNEVTVFWVFWLRGGVRQFSSITIVIFWIVWNVLILVLGTGGRVALWAHLGGFAAGLAIGLLYAVTGWIKPTEDEHTLLQVLGGSSA